MAMLAQARGVKRPLDMETLNEALPPTCAGAALHSELSSVPKRTKFGSEMAAQPQGAQAGASPQAGATPLAERMSRSAFPPLEPADPGLIEEMVMSCLASPKQERQRSPFRGEDSSAASAHAAHGFANYGAQGGQEKEKVYTQEEVQQLLKRNVTPKLLAMLNKFLDDRESVVRQRYNDILTERLNEQFQSFSKFNQDWVSRQLKDHPFSYVS